jgi:hypothetical protein
MESNYTLSDCYYWQEEKECLDNNNIIIKYNLCHKEELNGINA